MSLDDLHFSVLSLVLVSIERIDQTLLTAFENTSKQNKLCLKYSVKRILSIWKPGQTQYSLFDVLLTLLCPSVFS